MQERKCSREAPGRNLRELQPVSGGRSGVPGKAICLIIPGSSRSKELHIEEPKISSKGEGGDERQQCEMGRAVRGGDCSEESDSGNAKGQVVRSDGDCFARCAEGGGRRA